MPAGFSLGGGQSPLSIFEQMDTDGDGCLTPDELLAGVRRLGIPSSPSSVAAFFQRADRNHDGVVDYCEFQEYRSSREAELRAVYGQLCGDATALTSAALASGLERLQIAATDETIQARMQAIDTDSSGEISFEEFRNWLVLLPLDNPRAMFESFAREALLDDAQGSPHLAAKAVSGLGWHEVGAKLLAGAVAGVVSRTATAPVDRLKLLMQVAPAGGPKVGLAQICRQVGAEGGLKAFWRGNLVNCLKIAPETSAKVCASDSES
jgi:solute carrier family 25 phosphate transporter 23/24/25/41